MSRCSLAGTLAIVGAPVDVATSASAAAAKAVSFSCISALYPPRTAGQNSVDVSQGRVESRLVVPAVVVDPTPDVAVKHPGQVVQRLVAALVKRPASDRLSDHLESLVACRRAEQDAKGTPPASRQPRPERVAEKVEPLVWVVSASIFILAVDDLRLLRMKRQSAVGEPLLKRCAQRPRLRLTAAVAYGIIGMALEGDARMAPTHPHVERVMEKEIRQEGTDHSPNAKGNFHRRPGVYRLRVAARRRRATLV